MLNLDLLGSLVIATSLGFPRAALECEMADLDEKRWERVNFQVLNIFLS
jgi:hypothetical protein